MFNLSASHDNSIEPSPDLSGAVFESWRVAGEGCYRASRSATLRPRPGSTRALSSVGRLHDAAVDVCPARQFLNPWFD